MSALEIRISQISLFGLVVDVWTSEDLNTTRREALLPNHHHQRDVEGIASCETRQDRFYVVKRILDKVADNPDEPMDSMSEKLTFWIYERARRWNGHTATNFLDSIVGPGLSRKVANGFRRSYQFPIFRRRAMSPNLDLIE